MKTEQVQIRELAAWGLDENKYRPQSDEMTDEVERMRDALRQCHHAVLDTPVVPSVDPALVHGFDLLRDRDDLLAEMKGLDWELGTVDLRQLIAFQRRLVLDGASPHGAVPSSDDWPALIDVSFGSPISIHYRTAACDDSKLLVQSENPNLQLRTSVECDHLPVRIHGGSPFFEVAEFKGRWFLRDGYHRAYRLLLGGVVHVPAVMIHARTLKELGPVQPWFFSEQTLFEDRPPLVIDFLDDDLTIEYSRPRLYKTFRITIEESVEPGLLTGNTGEQV